MALTTWFERLLALAKDGYGDMHKLLAQTLLGEAVFENLKISDYFLEIVKLYHRKFRFLNLGTNEKETLQAALLQTMNEKLSEVFFHIVRVVDEYDEEQKAYYVMVSDMPFNETFAATVGGYSKQAMGLFDMWLQLMYVHSERLDGRISIDQALNAIGMMQYTMTKKSIQDTINKMVAEKWLIDENGILRLHPRTLAELRQTLNLQPFSVPSCSTCRNVVSNLPIAVKCQCGVTLHRHCYLAMNRATRGNQLLCDGCREPLVPPEIDDSL